MADKVDPAKKTKQRRGQVRDVNQLAHHIVREATKSNRRAPRPKPRKQQSGN
jgi:hypothetical protein